MELCQERFLNYSSLLSSLVNEDGIGLNDTTVAFLHQLFPNDIFVKAFSLLETHNIFLYVWSSSKGSNNGIHDVSALAETLYDDNLRSTTLLRMIVQSIDQEFSKEPIYVDVSAWFCSCSEYSECLQDLTSITIADEDPLDKYFEIYSHSTGDCFSRIRENMYMNTSKTLCQHLLAGAILLQTSAKVLKYFTAVKQTVSLICISNKDDWLKLHLNIVE